MIETIRKLAIKFEVADERKFERELYGLIEWWMGIHWKA